MNLEAAMTDIKIEDYGLSVPPKNEKRKSKSDFFRMLNKIIVIINITYS